MFEFIAENAATIITLAILSVIVGLVIFKMVQDKKQGKTSCGCGCNGCALADKCKNKK